MLFFARRRRKFCTDCPLFFERFRWKIEKIPILLPRRMELFSARWQFLKILPFQMEKNTVSHAVTRRENEPHGVVKITNALNSVYRMYI